MTRDTAAPLADVVEEFHRHEPRRPAAAIVTSLNAGLNLLHDQFYHRLHFDVETKVGSDSMLLPLSELKTQGQCKTEIELYQTVESAWAGHQDGAGSARGDWYLPWLGRQRLGQAWAEDSTQQRLRAYQALTLDKRRLALMDLLLEILPESGRSPLVLFRLFPLAIHLATALAWGDSARAQDARKQQLTCLPAIADCRQCHGGVLENGQACRVCGNPLWTFEWLNVTD